MEPKTVIETIDGIISGDYSPEDVLMFEEYMYGIFTYGKDDNKKPSPASNFFTALTTYSDDRISHITAEYLVRSMAIAIDSNTWTNFKSHIEHYEMLPRDNSKVDYYLLTTLFNVSPLKELTAIELYHHLVDKIGIKLTLKLFRLLNR